MGEEEVEILSHPSCAIEIIWWRSRINCWSRTTILTGVRTASKMSSRTNLTSWNLKQKQIVRKNLQSVNNGLWRGRSWKLLTHHVSFAFECIYSIFSKLLLMSSINSYLQTNFKKKKVKINKHIATTNIM